MPSGDERRRYVRVVDTLALKFKVLGDSTDIDEEISNSNSHYSQKINALENKLKILLPRISDKYGELVELISIVNSKVNLLSEEIHGAMANSDSSVLREVSISACGIAFPAEVKAGVDDNVWVDVVLQPEMVKITTIGKVVGCEKNDQEDTRFPYFIRLDLDNLSVDDEESLIQHVIRRESQMLREQRERRESGK